MMDILEFILYMSPVILIGVLGFRYLAMKDTANRYRAQKDAKISAQNRNAALQRGKPSQAPGALAGDELGQWVPALLEGFGIDPEVLFDDEMPPELRTFMPVIKGYVQAQGGLGGVLKQISGTQKAPDSNEREVI